MGMNPINNKNHEAINTIIMAINKRKCHKDRLGTHYPVTIKIIIEGIMNKENPGTPVFTNYTSARQRYSPNDWWKCQTRWLHWKRNRDGCIKKLLKAPQAWAASITIFWVSKFSQQISNASVRNDLGLVNTDFVVIFTFSFSIWKFEKFEKTINLFDITIYFYQFSFQQQKSKSLQKY